MRGQGPVSGTRLRPGFITPSLRLSLALLLHFPIHESCVATRATLTPQGMFVVNVCGLACNGPVRKVVLRTLAMAILKG